MPGASHQPTVPPMIVSDVDIERLLHATKIAYQCADQNHQPQLATERRQLHAVLTEVKRQRQTQET